MKGLFFLFLMILATVFGCTKKVAKKYRFGIFRPRYFRQLFENKPQLL